MRTEFSSHAALTCIRWASERSPWRKAAQHHFDQLGRRCRDVEGLTQTWAVRQHLSFFRKHAQLELAFVNRARLLPTFDASQVLISRQRQQETAHFCVAIDGDEPTAQIVEIGW